MADLDALAAEVAAVLDRHGVPANRRWIGRLDQVECDRLEIEGWPPQWAVTIDDAWHTEFDEAGAHPTCVRFRGTITPAAFDALSAVWARVHGEEG
jgi:hypothetical protein